jgi:hypothetical protein
MLALGSGESVTFHTCNTYTDFAYRILLFGSPQSSSMLSISSPLNSACQIPGAERLDYNNTGSPRTVFAFVGRTL